MPPFWNALMGEGRAALRLLTVAELDWRNGHEYALQAVRMLVDLGLEPEYRIAGSGPFLEAVAYARHQLGLEERVLLEPSPSRCRMRQLLAWADIFVLAAVDPGSEHNLDRALARGLAAVCTDVDDLPSGVASADRNVSVPRRDPLALADALAGLVPGAASGRTRSSQRGTGG